MQTIHTPRRGFTLIELLLVIGIIAILASIVIVAINPTKQLADARNAQRRSDVSTILNAVYQYAIDNNGSVPLGIPVHASATGAIICNPGVAFSTCPTGSANIATVNGMGYARLFGLTGSYLVSIPLDPSVAVTASGSEYRISKNSAGRITVRAHRAENSATISVTR